MPQQIDPMASRVKKLMSANRYWIYAAAVVSHSHIWYAVVYQKYLLGLEIQVFGKF